MKRCPACGRTFTNNTLINCLNDGTVLVEDAPTPPPYFGASPTTEAPIFNETLGAEAPPSAPPFEAPGTATYTDTPLSAIPELQSPEMQAALKEALDKAGMSGLLDADLAHSTVSIKTSITTGQSGTQFSSAGTPPLGFAQTVTPPYAATAMPRRKRSPWGALLFWLLLLIAALVGFRYLHHRTDVPADIVAAVKKADAAEVSAEKTLDPRPLASAYDGPALAHEQSQVAALRKAKQTQDEQLVSQKFSGYQVSSGGADAQVDVTETWDTTTYSEPGHTITDQKTGDVTPQTVYLTRKAGGWVVEKIEFHHS